MKGDNKEKGSEKRGQVLHYKSGRRLGRAECAKPNTVLDRLLRVSGIAVFVPHRLLAQEKRVRLDISPLLRPQAASTVSCGLTSRESRGASFSIRT